MKRCQARFAELALRIFFGGHAKNATSVEKFFWADVGTVISAVAVSLNYPRSKLRHYKENSETENSTG